ncbi:MAG: TIM44-like domain-containing protein [Myxococcaceae bacterium]|nr:TIM44-like domain-containing protein [Myxococcaceae bacterium]
MRVRIPRWAWLGIPLLVMLWALVPAVAFARSGGGEHYTSSHLSGSSYSSGGDDGGLVLVLIELAIRYPSIGIPLLVIFVVGSIVMKQRTGPDARTQRAFDRAEGARRTRVDASQVAQWVAALTAKDPAFSLQHLYGRARKLFFEVQQAWFKGDLLPVRPHLSDATFQRLTEQLDLMRSQGVRDAIADIEVLGVTLIGLEQNAWFDTVHLRIEARMRDTDVPASFSDEEALARAKQAPQVGFVEVWSFVRKPGVLTRIGQDLFQGKCPNCGAPFASGASNNCEYCGAVVNSGTYDWTLAEITQGVEHVPASAYVDGLDALRATDPALNLEVLEDRASLIFWRWIRAQSHAEPKALAKLATPACVSMMAAELAAQARSNRRRVFLECAVGGVIVRNLRPGVPGGAPDEAHVEIRWSAKTGLVPAGGKLPPDTPTQPQRWVFVLQRAAGATTRAENGMSTARCPNCNAALTDSLTSTCDFCQAELGSGARDWVLASASSIELWSARERSREPALAGTDEVIDREERTRLLYLMAMMAAADGTVDGRERKLLEMCARRWSVPWQNVERALRMGPEAFGALVERGSPEAEALLRGLVRMALIDGRVDRKERQLLEAAAAHLGIPEKLQPMLMAAR